MIGFNSYSKVLWLVGKVVDLDTGRFGYNRAIPSSYSTNNISMLLETDKQLTNHSIYAD